MIQKYLLIYKVGKTILSMISKKTKNTKDDKVVEVLDAVEKGGEELLKLIPDEKLKKGITGE